MTDVIAVLMHRPNLGPCGFRLVPLGVQSSSSGAFLRLVMEDDAVLACILILPPSILELPLQCDAFPVSLIPAFKMGDIIHIYYL